MPHKRSQKSRNRRPRGRRSGTTPGNPPSTALEYRGPVHSQAEMENLDRHVFIISRRDVISSTVGGVIANVIGVSDPSTYSDWNNILQVFSEYRILGVQCTFVPYNQYNKVTTTCRDLITVVDHENSNAIGTYTQALSYGSALIKSIENPWKRIFRASGAEEMGWASVASTTNLFWLKFYADTLTISTDYGVLITYARVQCRGRK
jgi:hypothetical protein